MVPQAMREMRHRRTSAGVDFLLYAEDPGATNFIAPLVPECRERGFTCLVIAKDTARKAFSDVGIPFEESLEFPAAKEALEHFAPRVVIVGTSENPKSLGLSLVVEARREGIPTVGAVDAFMNAAYRFRGETDDALAFAPDDLLVPDRWIKEEFANMGFPENHIFICGHPHYDFVRQRAETLKTIGKDSLRASLFPERAKDKVIALFAAETSTGLNPAQFLRSKEYTLRGRGGSLNRTDIVLEEFLDALPKGPERPYLVLRLHPKNEPEEFATYLNDFDQISREEPALEMVFACDCVFGISTMLLLEATLMERPTFSLVPRDVEKGWLPSVRAGLTCSASTREEVRNLLPGFLKDVSAGKRVSPEEAFVFGAKERTFSFLESILQR